MGTRVADIDTGLALQPRDQRLQLLVLRLELLICACSVSELLCETQADNKSMVSGTTELRHLLS